MKICELCCLRTGVKIAKKSTFLAADGCECYICLGAFLRLAQLCSNAYKCAKKGKTEYSSFCVSSSVKAESLKADEAALLESSPDNFTPLKNMLNAKAAETFSHLSGKRIALFGKPADATLRIDFSTNYAQVIPEKIFVFGRYEKLVEGLSQNNWLCWKCHGKGCLACNFFGKKTPHSIHQKIEEAFFPFFPQKTYFHGSGREDIDVRTIGRGRPFVLELVQPRKRKINLKKIEEKINKSNVVALHNLCFVAPGFVEVLKNSRFDKHYKATIDLGRQPEKNDLAKIESLSGLTISQFTPTRVMPRRPDKERKKKIISIKAKINGSYIIAEIFAECGTYIKELVSSDGGRTHPSIASVTDTGANCKNLVMSGVDDGFLDTLINGSLKNKSRC